jgi:hypothetical protein
LWILHCVAPWGWRRRIVEGLLSDDLGGEAFIPLLFLFVLFVLFYFVRIAAIAETLFYCWHVAESGSRLRYSNPRPGGIVLFRRMHIDVWPAFSMAGRFYSSRLYQIYQRKQ